MRQVGDHGFQIDILPLMPWRVTFEADDRYAVEVLSIGVLSVEGHQQVSLRGDDLGLSVGSAPDLHGYSSLPRLFRQHWQLEMFAAYSD